MERVWLKQYPPGVPADIDTTQYASLVELLEESFAKFADRKAFIAAYDNLSAGCNACHHTLDHAFIAIQRPNMLPYSDQNFVPQK